MTQKNSQWYESGLRFSCTECGHCCRVEGHVWVDAIEIDAMAQYLDLTLNAFGRRYLRRVEDRLSLVERPNRDCIFWENGCTIYPARPRQCRTFPFWKENLTDAVRWLRAGRECEGVGQGRLYSSGEIEDLRSGVGATGKKRPETDPEI